MKTFIAFLLFLVATAAAANEAKIRRVVEAALGGIKVEGVRAAAMPGLFEVRFKTADGIQVIYTDAEANYILEGSLFDTRAKRNLTDERLRQLSAIKFEQLPLDLAIKVQRGNGKRVLAMFSDPYCPACKQFEQVLMKLDDVTIYYFLYPVIRPERADHSRAAWCAADRGKAWLDLAVRGKAPAPAACDDPVDKTLEVGRSLRVNSTPTLFFANGERLSGGLPLAKLSSMLDEVAAATAKAK